MTFEEDDEVILHDEHSDHDSEPGTVTDVIENMFGDQTYNVSFEDGTEQGDPADALQAAGGPDAVEE